MSKSSGILGWRLVNLLIFPVCAIRIWTNTGSFVTALMFFLATTMGTWAMDLISKRLLFNTLRNLRDSNKDKWGDPISPPVKLEDIKWSEGGHEAVGRLLTVFVIGLVMSLWGLL